MLLSHWHNQPALQIARTSETILARLQMALMVLNVFVSRVLPRTRNERKPSIKDKLTTIQALSTSIKESR